MNNEPIEDGKLYILGKLSEAFNKEEWGEVRLMFAALRVNFPDEADQFLEHASEETRKMLEM